MPRQTPLYEQHLKSNAKMVDFSGWQMPLNYGSQIAEHNAVRNHAGIFDVSHMGIVEITGDVISFLRYLFANDVAKLKDNGALYTCMLNEKGGIIDDLIVYRFSENNCRLIINAGCRDKDLAWIKKHAEKFDVNIQLRDDLCLIALQGPETFRELEKVFGSIAETVNALKPFYFYSVPGLGSQVSHIVIARTGYTGEPGVEMMLPTDIAIKTWEKLIENGVQPCGLGARDTLRLEAGLNLYGADMTEKTSPLISNLSWTVSFKDSNRNFIGRDALLREKEKGISEQLVGIILESRGILRNHQKVKVDEAHLGEITSGSFSPTLNQSIALARIPMTDLKSVLVERRGEWLQASVVPLPFVNGSRVPGTWDQTPRKIINK